MRVRVLWVPPQERALVCGEVYDLPDDHAQRLLDAGEAEVLQPPPEPAKRGRKAG